MAQVEQFPMDAEPIVPADLRCVVRMTVRELGTLSDALFQWYRVVKELAVRSELLSKHLRTFQVGPAAKVATRINVGMIAIAVNLMGWPHWRLPSHCVSGFNVVGTLDPTGVYQLAPTEQPALTKGELLVVSVALIASIEAKILKAEAAEHIMSACVKGFKNGFWFKAVSQK